MKSLTIYLLLMTLAVSNLNGQLLNAKIKRSTDVMNVVKFSYNDEFFLSHDYDYTGNLGSLNIWNTELNLPIKSFKDYLSSLVFLDINSDFKFIAFGLDSSFQIISTLTDSVYYESNGIFVGFDKINSSVFYEYNSNGIIQKDFISQESLRLFNIPDLSTYKTSKIEMIDSFVQASAETENRRSRFIWDLEGRLIMKDSTSNYVSLNPTGRFILYHYYYNFYDNEHDYTIIDTNSSSILDTLKNVKNHLFMENDLIYISNDSLFSYDLLKEKLNYGISLIVSSNQNISDDEVQGNNEEETIWDWGDTEDDNEDYFWEDSFDERKYNIINIEDSTFITIENVLYYLDDSTTKLDYLDSLSISPDDYLVSNTNKYISFVWTSNDDGPMDSDNIIYLRNEREEKDPQAYDKYVDIDYNFSLNQVTSWRKVYDLSSSKQIDSIVFKTLSNVLEYKIEDGLEISFFTKDTLISKNPRYGNMPGSYWDYMGQLFNSNYSHFFSLIGNGDKRILRVYETASGTQVKNIEFTGNVYINKVQDSIICLTSSNHFMLLNWEIEEIVFSRTVKNDVVYGSYGWYLNNRSYYGVNYYSSSILGKILLYKEDLNDDSLKYTAINVLNNRIIYSSRKFKDYWEDEIKVTFRPESNFIMVYDHANKSLEMYDEQGLKIFKKNLEGDFKFTNNGDYIIGLTNKGDFVYDLTSKSEYVFSIPNKDSFMEPLIYAEFFNGYLYMVVLKDGYHEIWRLKDDNIEKIVNLYKVKNSYILMTDEGLFDGPIDAFSSIYFVDGLEVIDANQLKDRYYEPGLWSKLIGLSDEPLRDAKGLNDIELYPQIELYPPQKNKGKLGINLKNQGGGYGKVIIAINGKEVTADARGKKFDENAPSVTINYDLEDHPYLKPGEVNEIEVKAYNKEEYLSSRGEKIYYIPDGTKNENEPSLHGIIIGTANYSGDALDLKYAGKDAVDFSTALDLVGDQYFNSDKVNLTVLSTENKDFNSWPTKENIQKAFQDLSTTAKPNDVLVVYLSGHGVNYGGSEGDFYYLTSEASSGNLKDPAIRESVGISSAELTEYVKMVPALKQVLIMDACHSGQVAEDLMASRADRPSSEIRALERMKDRTGTYILAGSAADAVSYETSVYGQGLLTYSLLFGMKGAALRENKFVDIMELFQFCADNVPKLAENIGGVQKPEVRVPYGGQSFDIGISTEDVQEQIILPSPKPLYVRSVFQNDDTFNDDLRLSEQVDELLKETSSSKSEDQQLIFIDASRFVEAYSLKGRYSKDGDQFKADVRLFKGDQLQEKFEVSAEKDQLAEKIVKRVSEK